MAQLNSIRIALSNVRKCFFHTLLSILGIVIGVAALVGILSLIDGMENYAKGQISKTTSLETVIIETNSYKTVNGLRLRKEEYGYLTASQFTQLVQTLDDSVMGVLQSRSTEEIRFYDEQDTIKTASEMMAYMGINSEKLLAQFELKGRMINQVDITQKRAICVIDAQLAQQLTKGKETEPLIGKMITTKLGDLEIVGVGQELNERSPSKLIFPISLFTDQQLKQRPPKGTITASDVRKVKETKQKIKDWLAIEFPQHHQDFRVVTNEGRVQQAEQGFKLFRIIMGFIVGLSVLVGGIGVMNVMLISINERTTEIGICKAMGAKRKDIFIQYLSESITISGLGSLLGLIFGILGTFVAVPIIKNLTELPFEAAYTTNTLLPPVCPQTVL